MTGHFKKVCRKCGRVVSQCRCISPNKNIIEVICDDCLRQKEKTDA